MKKVCGFKLTSKNAFMATLEGTKQNPKILAKENLPFPSGQRPDQFVEWALTQLKLVLDREKPDAVAYKLSAGLGLHDQIFHVYFGLAMLNLAAKQLGISIQHVAPTSLRPRAFGLHKYENIDEYIKGLFAEQSTPWNSNIREAVSISLLRLDK